MLTTRRGFLQLIGVVAAGAYVEPERLVKVFDMATRQEAIPGVGYVARGVGMFPIWYQHQQELARIARASSRSWGYLINAEA